MPAHFIEEVIKSYRRKGAIRDANGDANGGGSGNGNGVGGGNGDMDGNARGNGDGDNDGDWNRNRTGTGTVLWTGTEQEREVGWKRENEPKTGTGTKVETGREQGGNRNKRAGTRREQDGRGKGDGIGDENGTRMEMEGREDTNSGICHIRKEVGYNSRRCHFACGISSFGRRRVLYVARTFEHKNRYLPDDVIPGGYKATVTGRRTR